MGQWQPNNPWQRAKADAMVGMIEDGEILDWYDSSPAPVSRDGKTPTTRNTVYPTDATRGTGHAAVHSNPTAWKRGHKFATVFERNLSQSAPPRIVGRYRTMKKAIADAKVINSMKDTLVIVIEYDGKSDYVDREYTECHTVWRE